MKKYSKTALAIIELKEINSILKYFFNSYIIWKGGEIWGLSSCYGVERFGKINNIDNISILEGAVIVSHQLSSALSKMKKTTIDANIMDNEIKIFDDQNEQLISLPKANNNIFSMKEDVIKNIIQDESILKFIRLDMEICEQLQNNNIQRISIDDIRVDLTSQLVPRAIKSEVSLAKVSQRNIDEEIIYLICVKQIFNNLTIGNMFQALNVL